MLPAEPQTASSYRARRLLLIATVATVVLYIIPFGQWLIYPLMLFSTYAHEMGHGLTAELVGGEFIRFKMYANGSGVAQHAGHYGAFSRALVSAGGLMGPAVLGAIFFYLGRKAAWARVGLYVFGAGSLLSVALVVRNGFGVGFVIIVALICLAVARWTSPLVAQFVTVFLAVQLSLTVFSRGDYLFTDVAQTSVGAMPSDTAQISEALIGPYWFWGAIVGAFSVAVLVFGLWLFWRSDTEDAPAR